VQFRYGLIAIFALTTEISFPSNVKNNVMKKVFAILAVAGLLTACNNDAGSEKKTDDQTKIVPPPEDSSKMMHDPAHNMIPGDTSGRRPRD
jgi:hypothetical protein